MNGERETRDYELHGFFIRKLKITYCYLTQVVPKLTRLPSKNNMPNSKRANIP